jgi:hypothetical protein
MRIPVPLLARVTLLSAALSAVTLAIAAEPPQIGSADGDQQAEPATSDHERAERELKKQKKQRILGIIPNFNTSNVQNAAPLSPRQKFGLALRGAIDPFSFVAAGLDAALEQAQNSFPGYGQGAQGYGKRVGAAYADAFSAGMFGGAIFPSLLHQDPRYFRKGSGRFGSRFLYAVVSTVRAKNDNGHWAPNYSNVLGNLAAGGVSNLYYPASDRGVELTFERALTVSAEGAIGSVFVEFWPDISAKLFHHH